MNCLDCTALDRHHAPAIGACHGCGVGVCLEHAWLRYVAGRHAGMAGPSLGPTRALLCGFCRSEQKGTRPAAEPGATTVRPCQDPVCLC